jgi:hypothetical protein
MKIEIFPDADAVAQNAAAVVAAEAEERSLHGAASSWPLAAATPLG